MACLDCVKTQISQYMNYLHQSNNNNNNKKLIIINKLMHTIFIFNIKFCKVLCKNISIKKDIYDDLVY